MGTKKSESNHTPIIRFQMEDQAIKITFSQKESVDVPPLVLDILTEAYRERLQRASLYPKAG